MVKKNRCTLFSEFCIFNRCIHCVALYHINYIPSEKKTRFSLHVVEKDRTLYLDNLFLSKYLTNIV